LTHRLAKSIARRIDHGRSRRECPDDITQPDLDQWLTDGGRDLPDPDSNTTPGTDSSVS
jgi:hypothetical protein